jgi:Tfp pilus assembly PilM family ATPase
MPALRVHDFASFVHADNASILTSELKHLAEHKRFPRRAWVNVWDVQSSHQYLLLPTGTQQELESAAMLRGASLLGLADGEVTLATAVGSTRAARGRQKTELSFFAAESEAMRQRLRPIVDAGFLVDGVTTPCGALWSQARLRRPALPREAHAYVALGSAFSALAIFSNGFFLYGKDLNWGYAAPRGGAPVIDREDLAGRMFAELRRSFLFVKQYWEEDVSQVLLCGEMPEIRSLTVPLIERLGIEVETLDTLDGIEATGLPEGFADQAATFRLASSIAVEPSPANLLPVEIAVQHVNRTRRRVMAAGLAAAVVLAAFLYGLTNFVIDDTGQGSPKGQRYESSGTNVVPTFRSATTSAARSATTRRPSQQGPSTDAQNAPSTVQGPSPVAVNDTARQGDHSPAAAPNVGARASIADVTTVPRQRPRETLKPVGTTLRSPPTSIPEPATEADPKVGSILFSEQRRLAIIDGRIVRPGDRLGTGFVQAIDRDSVVITTAAGRSKRLLLNRPQILRLEPTGQ